MMNSRMYGIVVLTLSCLLAVQGFAMAEQDGQGKSIGVMWFAKSAMADLVLQGMQEQLNAKAPGIKIEILKDQADAAALAPTYEKWQKEKNAIVYLRSAGATYMMKNPPAIPGFIGASNDPKSLGVIKNPQAPEGNITGVTYSLAAIQHLKLYKNVLPELKSVGLLCEQGHPAGEVERPDTQAACKELGLAYHETVVTSKDELEAKVAELAGKVDLLIISNMKLIMDNSEIVSKAAGKTPVASYAEAPLTRKQALIGLVPNDIKLGRMLADSIIEVVVQGKAISSVPVKTDPEPRIMLCPEKMDAWNVNVPSRIVKMAELVK